MNSAQHWRLNAYFYRDQMRRWRRIAYILAGVLAGIVTISIYHLVST